MKYILYARKSTEEDDRQVLSIEAQLVELQEYAAKEKLEIIASLCEAKTAKEPGEKHRLEPYFNFGGRKFFNPMESNKKLTGIPILTKDICIKLYRENQYKFVYHNILCF